MAEQGHWVKTTEQGRYFGIKITQYAYKLLGQNMLNILMYPVMTYYFLASKKARDASKTYRDLIKKEFNLKLSGFVHFIAFGRMLIDKIAAWSDDIQLSQINFPNKQALLDQIHCGQGAVILTAHMGNLEIARSLSRLIPGIKVNALVYDKHAGKFNETLSEINPEFAIDLISIETVDMSLAMTLTEKVEQGELIVIAADRTSVTNPDRSIDVELLKQTAKLPQGAFILAGLLKAPIYFMACLKEPENRFTIFFEKLSDKLNLDKSHREQNIQQCAQSYVSELSKLCEKYPLQWFNFYDFWKQ